MFHQYKLCLFYIYNKEIPDFPLRGGNRLSFLLKTVNILFVKL